MSNNNNNNNNNSNNSTNNNSSNNNSNNKTLYWIGYILMMIVIFSYYVLIEMMYLALFSDLIARGFFTMWVGIICTGHLVIFNYVNLRKDILEEDLNSNIKMGGFVYNGGPFTSYCNVISLLF